VASCIEAFADNDTIADIGFSWLISLIDLNYLICYLEEFFFDRTQHFKRNFNFGFRILRLDGGADYGDVVVLLADTMHG
jgi:hypothetical protein